MSTATQLVGACILLFVAAEIIGFLTNNNSPGARFTYHRDRPPGEAPTSRVR